MWFRPCALLSIPLISSHSVFPCLAASWLLKSALAGLIVADRSQPKVTPFTLLICQADFWSVQSSCLSAWSETHSSVLGANCLASYRKDRKLSASPWRPWTSTSCCWSRRHTLQNRTTYRKSLGCRHPAMPRQWKAPRRRGNYLAWFWSRCDEPKPLEGQTFHPFAAVPSCRSAPGLWCGAWLDSAENSLRFPLLAMWVSASVSASSHRMRSAPN